MPYLKTVYLILLPVVCSLTAPAQPSRQNKQHILMLKRTIELNHYQPRPVDDVFSTLMFDYFLGIMDDDHEILTPADQRELNAFRTRLDDELNGNGWQFLDRFTVLFKTRLEHLDSVLVKSGDKTGKHRQLRRFLDDANAFNDMMVTAYSNALSNTFDPHSSFMPPAAKERFESRLSKDGMYYGFSLNQNDHSETVIERVTPGSPAWKSGDLNTGDVLIKVTPINGKAISLAEADPGEVSRLLDGADDNMISLTVRKADGKEKTVSLVKEKMENEENNVKGFILTGARRVGYIYLPDFYSADNDYAGGCANDVAKEIVKLKKENIDGLILDLRFNGGGSMQEALDMAGIFIDAGPLGMTRDRTGKTTVMKDMNVGTIYDGPLTLLVNSQSASASELLAAVLQDYNRALIVGGTTYGKGTAQIIIPVDTTGSTNNVQEYGYVKLTIAKFYRVSGKTTQHTGVIPDIRLPDLFDQLNYHESASPSALAADTVKRNGYYRPLAAIPVSDLNAKSMARTNADKDFQNISTLAKKGSEDSDDDTDTDPTLHTTATNLYQVSNNQFDKNVISSDGFLSAQYKKRMDKLSRDVYVIETYHILEDLINNKKP